MNTAFICEYCLVQAACPINAMIVVQYEARKIEILELQFWSRRQDLHAAIQNLPEVIVELAFIAPQEAERQAVKLVGVSCPPFSNCNVFELQIVLKSNQLLPHCKACFLMKAFYTSKSLIQINFLSEG